MLDKLKLKKSETPVQEPQTNAQEKVEWAKEQIDLDNQPQTIAENNQVGGSQPHSTDHFDELIGRQEEVEQEREFEQASQELIGPDEFHLIFCGGFNAAHQLTKLQSLVVDKSDGSAKACSGAIYETIMEVPSLRFILSPTNKWWGRIIAIGAFAIPVSIGVADELSARKDTKSSIANPIEKTANDAMPAMSLKEMAKK